MDPFEPIQVDAKADSESADEKSGKPAPLPTAAPGAKADPADAALAVAHNLYILGVIEHQTDATLAGAAEVTGAATDPVPVAVRADPDDTPHPAPPVGSGGDGCGLGAFALFLTLALASGAAAAVLR